MYSWRGLYSWCLYWFLATFLTDIPGILSLCVFPDYLQTNTSHRDWRTHIKSQYTDFTVTITVQRDILKRTANGDPQVITWKCQTQHSDDTFIVRYDVGQRSTQFMCVQFIKRSDNVLQLRTSEVTYSMLNICEGDMPIDPWLVVDKAHVLLDAEACPLEGGYDVRLYNKEMYEGVCDAYKDSVWFESECKHGTGLYFHFSESRCIPDVYMSRTQNTVCVTTWTEDAYIFLLIRHNTRAFMWLIRYPVNAQNSFVAHLMKELYASTDLHLSGTDKYIRMTNVRSIQRPVSRLCTDDGESCQYGTPCTTGDNTPLMCARTCGHCNNTRPAICSFKSSLLGDWNDATHIGRPAVTMESNALNMYYSRLTETLNCVRWDKPYTGPEERYITYEMLVTGYENGCRPTYSCVRMVHEDQSPVMFLQLSKEKHWPFTSNVNDAINCHSFEFEGDNNVLVPNRYRSKHYKLLYSSSLDTGKRCNLPLNNQYNYTVTISDDTQCPGGITASSNAATTFSVNITACRQTSIVTSIPRDHHCMESLRFFSSELMIVTKSVHEPLQIFCWVFPKKTKDAFYLVEAAHCNANTRKRIVRGHLKPLAAFHRDYGTTTTMVLPTTPPLSNQNSPSGENSVMEPTITPGLNDSVSKATNATGPGTDPAKYTSPIVVIAAVLFFVIFQIPCMCKN